MNEEEMTSILQKALDKGWEEFIKNDLSLFKDFSSYIYSANFYESKYRNIIPNPAYDNAAKRIGKYFLQSAAELELSFIDVFPGDFSTSKEYEDEGFEVREFTIKTYSRGKPFGDIKISFSHIHGSEFGFPNSPKLKIYLHQ